jgi:hypothetical protein
MNWNRDRTGRYRSECGRFEIRRNYGRLRGWILRDAQRGDEVHAFHLAVAKHWAEQRAAARGSP